MCNPLWSATTGPSTNIVGLFVDIRTPKAPKAYTLYYTVTYCYLDPLGATRGQSAHASEAETGGWPSRVWKLAVTLLLHIPLVAG